MRKLTRTAVCFMLLTIATLFASLGLASENMQLERLQEVQVGMAEADVLMKLGEPTEMREESFRPRKKVWYYMPLKAGEPMIEIQFFEGKVSSISQVSMPASNGY